MVRLAEISSLFSTDISTVGLYDGLVSRGCIGRVRHRGIVILFAKEQDGILEVRPDFEAPDTHF